MLARLPRTRQPRCRQQAARLSVRSHSKSSRASRPLTSAAAAPSGADDAAESTEVPETRAVAPAARRICSYHGCSGAGLASDE